jgi:hypothetical protein
MIRALGKENIKRNNEKAERRNYGIERHSGFCWTGHFLTKSYGGEIYRQMNAKNSAPVFPKAHAYAAILVFMSIYFHIMNQRKQ